MANETWSKKPLITEISNTTEFCILDEAIPKNKRINAKTILDLKAPKENAEFTGTMKLNGVPIGTNDLNGTNYLMVYGVGTPTDNAAELQAAYNEAKKMPRHLGTFNPGNSITIYKGQTFVDSTIPVKFFIANTDFTGTIAVAPAGTFAGRDSQSEFDAALARRASVIVAPGEYDFGSSTFTIDATGVDVVSLTGNADVIIRRLIVSADYIYIKGITALNDFGVRSSLSNIVIEDCESKTSLASYFNLKGANTLLGTFINCKGTDCSFADNDGGPGKASGTFINCTGGDKSFGGGGGGTADGTFTNCVGGDNSFAGLGGGTASGKFIGCTGGETSFGLGSGSILTGTLENCKLTSGTFPTPTGAGKIYNCIDGNGNLINTPLPIFADNAAAASLAVGTMYRTSAGVQMIKW